MCKGIQRPILTLPGVLVVLLLLLPVRSPAAGTPTQGVPVADFQLRGDLVDRAGRGATAEIANAAVTPDGLRLVRGYENAGEGYRATFRVPGMSPTNVTVVVDLAPLDLREHRRRGGWLESLLRFAGLPVPGRQRVDARNLVTLGYGWRWLGLNHAPGHLQLTLNNQTLLRDFTNVVLETGRWHRLAVALDVPRGQVRVCVDGRPLVPVDLDPGFVLKTDPDPAAEREDRAVTFANYGNGQAFHGYVGRLRVFDRALDPASLAALGPAPGHVGVPGSAGSRRRWLVIATGAALLAVVVVRLIGRSHRAPRARTAG
jgi:hypothetical protein